MIIIILLFEKIMMKMINICLKNLKSILYIVLYLSDDVSNIYKKSYKKIADLIYSKKLLIWQYLKSKLFLMHVYNKNY